MNGGDVGTASIIYDGVTGSTTFTFASAYDVEIVLNSYAPISVAPSPDAQLSVDNGVLPLSGFTFFDIGNVVATSTGGATIYTVTAVINTASTGLFRNGFELTLNEIVPDPVPPAVPLPAAGFLLIGALGLVAASRRRS